MNEKDFQDLLNEIDSMSIEEYDKFHDKALRMKEVGLKAKTYELGCGTCDNHDADSCCSCGLGKDFLFFEHKQ